MLCRLFSHGTHLRLIGLDWSTPRLPLYRCVRCKRTLTYGWDF
jgi:hypothetical protein